MAGRPLGGLVSADPAGLVAAVPLAAFGERLWRVIAGHDCYDQVER